MNSFELICSLDPGLVEKMQNLGILRTNVIRDVEVFRYYLQECTATGKKLQARANTADKYHISVETVSKIIQRMKF